MNNNLQVDLYRVSVSDEIIYQLAPILKSGQIASGPNVKAFEQALQDYIGNPLTTTTSDVCSSIRLALIMAGVKPGDEVIASPMACVATNVPIVELHATPRWVDIDVKVGGMCPDALRAGITEKTKAILVFHWAGYPAHVEQIYTVAREFRIPVVEDAGEGFGAEVNNRKIGSLGADYTVFSFYANRHLTTLEGAAISFSSPEEYERARWLKRYGIHQPSFRGADGEISASSDIPVVGGNTYLNNVAASIGIAQIKSINQILLKYRENAAFYNAALGDVAGITPLRSSPNATPSYWVYTLLAKNRDGLLRKLRAADIYASKVHLRNDLYTCFKSTKRVLPGVDQFSAETLSIPCGWWVTDSDRERIVATIRAGW